MQKVIGIVVIFAIGIAVALQRGKQDQQVDERIDHATAKLAEILATEQHPEHTRFIDENIDSALEYAMRTAYTPPGRRRAATFDADLYVNAAMESLLLKVKAQHGTDRQLRTCITNLQIAVEQAVKAGEFSNG